MARTSTYCGLGNSLLSFSVDDYDNANEASNHVTDLTNLVNFVEEDNDLILCRRFRRLHLYTIYRHHMILVDLENELRAYEKKPASHLFRSPIGDFGELLVRIEASLKALDDALTRFERSVNDLAPPSHVIKDLSQIVKDEEHIELSAQLDLKNLEPQITSRLAKPKGWIHKVMDQHKLLHKPFKIESEERAGMIRYSEDAVRRFEDIFINTLFCILLIIPIVALSYIRNRIVQLVAVLGCVLVASIVTSYLANTIHKTSLAAMAGYAAILVVFLGNNSGNGGT